MLNELRVQWIEPPVLGQAFDPANVAVSADVIVESLYASGEGYDCSFS